MVEYKINEFITLKLEDEKTNLYVNGELFEHCSIILLNRQADRLKELQQIDSIDELTELSVDEVANAPYHMYEDNFEVEVIDIPPHVRFLVHCSNIQAWAEHNYDTRLLHSNLSFPLLKRLTEVGDLKAKQRFKEEIISRFFNGTKNVQKFLLQEKYMKLITGEEKYSLFKLVEEENAIKELERLTEKEFYLDSKDSRYDQSFLLEEGIVKELNLARCYIEELPEIIKNLKNLVILRISSDQLKSLPDWIGELKSVKKLRIFVNLEKLPESFGNLKSLEELRISSNQLRMLPESFGKLTSLKKLNLSNNKLIKLPESFGNLKRLENLNLFDNELETLPESFGNLLSLKRLDLRDNKLMTLPKSFGNLNSLRYADLYNNQIKQLPDSIGNLKSIQTLTLSKNLLEEIPISIGDLKTLTWLDVDSNKISTLPSSIGKLTSLVNLECGENQIERLPESICKLKTLKDLRIRNNNISELPPCIGELDKLEIISISDNPIRSLPPTTINLKSLQSLYIEGTEISESEIEWLKTKFGKWTVHTSKYG